MVLFSGGRTGPGQMRESASRTRTGRSDGARVGISRCAAQVNLARKSSGRPPLGTFSPPTFGTNAEEPRARMPAHLVRPPRCGGLPGTTQRTPSRALLGLADALAARSGMRPCLRPGCPIASRLGRTCASPTTLARRCWPGHAQRVALKESPAGQTTSTRRYPSGRSTVSLASWSTPGEWTRPTRHVCGAVLALR